MKKLASFIAFASWLFAVSISGHAFSAEKTAMFSWQGKVGPSVDDIYALYVRFDGASRDPLQNSVTFFNDHLYDTDGLISFATVAKFRVYDSLLADAQPVPFNYQLNQLDLNVNGVLVDSEDLSDYLVLEIDNVEHTSSSSTVYQQSDANKGLEIYPEFQFLSSDQLPVSQGDKIELLVDLVITPYQVI